MKKRKLLEKILQGSKNVRFGEFVSLIEAFGFSLDRIRGSHHVFTHPRMPRAFPVQNIRGQAKPYQVRQFIDLIEQYNLQLNEDDDND